jgi:hypothetical protein
MSRNPEDGEPTIDVSIRTPTGDATWPVQSTSAIEGALDAGLQVGVDGNGFYVRNWSAFEESFASIDEAAQAFLDGVS